MGETLADEVGLKKFADEGVVECVEKLLAETADHEEVISGVISATAAITPTKVLALIERLNTQHRRSVAYEMLAHRVLDEDSTTSNFSWTADFVQSFITEIANVSARQRVAAHLVQWLASCPSQSFEPKGMRKRLELALEGIADSDVRAVSVAEVVGRTTVWEGSEDLDSELVQIIRREWSRVEDDWTRSSCGCHVVAAIAQGKMDVAVDLLNDVTGFIEPRMSRLDAQATWFALVQLQGRALASLAATRSMSPTDVKQVADAAKNILSDVERARLLSRIALYIHQADKDLARQVVEEHVAPLVGQLVGAPAPYSTELIRMIEESLPAIWLVQQGVVLTYLRRLDDDARDESLDLLLGFVIENRIPREPWSSHAKRRIPVTDSIVEEALVLLREVTLDTIFSHYVGKLVGAISDRTLGARINVNQKANFVAAIRDRAQAILPAPRGIQHNGYVILTKAQLLVLERGTHSDWSSLLADARAIPNLSDSCFVLAYLVELVPRRFESLRRSAFDAVVECWKRLPTLEERVSRLEVIFEQGSPDFRSDIRKLVGDCISVSLGDGGNPSPLGEVRINVSWCDITGWARTRRPI